MAIKKKKTNELHPEFRRNDSVLVDRREVYGKIFETLLELIDYGDQHNVSEFPLRGVEIVLNGESMPVKSISKIGFDGFIDEPNLEIINADLNCLDGDYTFIFTRDDAYSQGWDEITGNMAVLKNPDSMLSALSGVKNEYELEAYREGVISVLQEAYKAARPTNEVVRGNYAGEFARQVTWSRALDFSVSGMPEVKGLRYIEFADSTLTLTRLLMKDGNSKPLNELTKSELSLVRDGLQKHLDAAKKTRHQVKL